MLVVTVAITSQSGFLKEIGKMTIGNVSNLASTSDYLVRRRTDYNPLTGAMPEDKNGEVKEHERASDVWVLVRKAIECTDETEEVDDSNT